MRIVIFILFLMYNGIVFASSVTAEGEALIENNDNESARSIALLRAKWSAVESVSPAKVKIESIINNSKIIDEAIKTELTATISSYDIIEEKIVDNKYIVKINANVIENNADNNDSGLPNDDALCVIIGGVMPNGSINYNNNFTLEAINLFKEQGINVAEVNYNGISRTIFLNAVKHSKYDGIINITNKYKCENILLGSLSILDKGNNTGYGSFNINIAGGDLSWKLIDNNKKLLKTGFFNGRGQGATLEDAALSVYNTMAKNTAVKVVSQVLEVLSGIDKKSIRVVLTGANTSLDDFNELRDDLKNIPFVLNVRELNQTSLSVNYPDKALYLGIFLEKDSKYKVTKLSDNEIIIRK